MRGRSPKAVIFEPTFLPEKWDFGGDLKIFPGFQPKTWNASSSSKWKRRGSKSTEKFLGREDYLLFRRAEIAKTLWR
jgi:hypothetical protein